MPEPISAEEADRRHLSVGQRTAIGYKLMERYETEAAQRKRELAGTRSNPGELGADLHQPPESKTRAPRAADRAAAVVGVSGRAMGQFKRIAEQAPDLVPKIEANELALDRAERIIRDRESS